MAQHKSAHKTTGGSRRSSVKSMKKAGVSRSVKSAKAKRGDSELPGDEEISIDRRRTERRDDEPEATEVPSNAGPQLERRKKVNRRRQIDPTTCERDYTEQEVEFMNALDEYKRKSGRMFPTCSEVLEVVRGLGYVKLQSVPIGALVESNSPTPSAKPMQSDWSASSEVQESQNEFATVASWQQANS